MSKELLTFQEQIRLIKLEEKAKEAEKLKKKKGPVRKRYKSENGELVIHYGRNRVRGNGEDLSYRKIANLILSGVTIKAICTLTGKDMTERVVLGTMNNYLANHKGNLDKYLEILMTSKKS